MSTRANAAVIALVVFVALTSRAGDEQQQYGFGRPATDEEIARADIDVRLDGLGLPPGSGTAAEGLRTYQRVCAACHGLQLQGNAVLGVRQLLGESRYAVNNLPYAPPLFAYIRRSMPLMQPGSLNDDEVYGLVAYLLVQAGVVEGNDLTLDAEALSGIEMPNRQNFFSDDRSRLSVD